MAPRQAHQRRIDCRVDAGSPCYARAVHYDLTLKELFHGKPSRLLEILTGGRAVETLNVEFPAIKKRQPDVVMRLDDGRIYHLELQSGGDATMPWRMLEYYSLVYQHYRAPVLQHVLYVGAGPNPLAESIAQDSLQYRYDVIDIRDIDCRSLLASQTLEDNLLALLCALDDEAQVVRTVLGKIAGLDENSRRDALQRLEILCGLRPLKPVIQREIEKMPISLNLADNPFFQEAFAEGKQEGEHALLSKLLEERFGPLPETIAERLKGASPTQLEAWGLRLLSAESLEEVFSNGA